MPDHPTSRRIQPAIVLHLGFGRRLRSARVGNNVSQEALSRGTGVHRITVGKMEAGGSDPRLTTILRLAYGLGTSPASLVPSAFESDPPT